MVRLMSLYHSLIRYISFLRQHRYPMRNPSLDVSSHQPFSHLDLLRFYLEICRIYLSGTQYIHIVARMNLRKLRLLNL